MKLQAMKLLPALILLVSSLMPTSAIADQPAWCKKPVLLEAEITICNDKTLSKADSLLDQMYRAVLSFRGFERDDEIRSTDIISDQRDWLEQRNKLAGKPDILDAYTTRIKALTMILKFR